MLPAFRYDDILRDLKRHFAPDRPELRLLGICFCRPTQPLAREELFPSLPYYHFRSGAATNFYFAGFRPGSEPERGEEKIPSPQSAGDWLFSPSAFNDLRKELEGMTRWRYSGGCDVILTGVTRSSDGHPTPDFSTAIALCLDRLRDQKATLELGILFEDLFRYAETHSSGNPTWAFSDNKAGKTVKNSLMDLVLLALPEPLRDRVKRAANFAVMDLRPAAG